MEGVDLASLLSLSMTSFKSDGLFSDRSMIMSTSHANLGPILFNMCQAEYQAKTLCSASWDFKEHLSDLSYEV